MNLVSVAVQNTRRNLFRSLLTVFGVAIAMLAFLLLRTVLSAWLVGVQHAATDRLATRHKVTFVMPLPKRYVETVSRVQGVQSVTWMTFFGGKVPGKEEQLGSVAVDAPSFLRVYDELILPEPQRERFLQNRRGAIVGVALARQFGWKVGDHITLDGTTFAGEWEFSIEGIYTVKRRSVDELSMFFHWSYLNDSLPEQLREQVGWISSKVASARDAPIVAKRIDDVFESRETQTLSMSERAVNNSFMGMASTLLDAIQIVSLVILVIMLLILGNTIAMGVRERTQEYAVLRAIGFLPHHVIIFVLGEATALACAGGLLAVGLGVPFIDSGVARYLEENMAGFFPFFHLATRDMLLALFLSGVLAVCAALLPALRASRLQVTDALRKLG